MKQVLLAKTAGFCFGVKRAVRLAEKASEEYDESYTLGPIIHNRHVVEKLEAGGVREIGSPEQLPIGGNVIIRSHGIGRNEYKALAEKKANIIDATCPDVAKIHDIVRSAADRGRTVIIIGAKIHPEVLAICGWCDKHYVFENSDELESWLKSDTQNAQIPLTIVYQTTGTRKNMLNCDKIIKKQCTNFEVFDTICKATFNRQEEAAQIASQCDAMVVVGGKNSANSLRLAEICREHCPRVFFVESAEELVISDFEGADTVGITAGASTPSWIIKEVYDKMSEEIKVEGTEESFEELLEKSIKTLYTGEKVTGIVAAITPTEVSVDLGTKQSGYIPMSELTDDPTVKAEDVVKVGDEIETYVMRVNDVEGTVMLSKKRLDTVKNWEYVENARAEGTPVEGIVVEDNKGGVVVSVKGIRVFVPASQTGLGKNVPMTELLKKKVQLKITEVNQSRRRVVGSIRAVQYEARKAAAEKVWEEIEVGKHYKGTVKSLTSYGAFVDIGGIDGMVHVSELSWSRIKNPAEVVSVGDEIDVYVISFDKETKKISLGYKTAEDNPWTKFTSKYEVGSVADVKIVKLMPFGAFAEIIPGVDGLIHISQIANRRIGKPDEVLTEGEQVQAKITEIDNDKQKVSLSIRALQEPEAAAEEPAEDTAEDAE